MNKINTTFSCVVGVSQEFNRGQLNTVDYFLDGEKAFSAPNFPIVGDSISEIIFSVFRFVSGPCYSHDSKSDTSDKKITLFQEKWAKIFQQIDTDYQKVLDNTFSLE